MKCKEEIRKATRIYYKGEYVCVYVCVYECLFSANIIIDWWPTTIEFPCQRVLDDKVNENVICTRIWFIFKTFWIAKSSYFIRSCHFSHILKGSIEDEENKNVNERLRWQTCLTSIYFQKLQQMHVAMVAYCPTQWTIYLYLIHISHCTTCSVSTKH